MKEGDTMLFVESENGEKIINVEKVERFELQVKPDAVLIVAVINGKAICIGRYKDRAEAANALSDMYLTIREGYSVKLTLSTYGLYDKPKQHDGKKQKSHGSS